MTSGARTVMGKYYERVIDTLSCPTCGAKPGQQCRTATGRVTHKVHSPRMNQKR